MNPLSLLTSGLSLPAGLDPRQLLGQLQSAESGPLKRLVAFAGKPVIINLNKTDGVDSNKYWKEKKEAGKLYYLLALANRYIFCWGAVLGVALKFCDFSLGRYIQSNSDGVNPLVSFGKQITGLAWMVCIGAAGYSQFTGANKKYYVDETEQLIARGENDLNATIKILNNNDDLAKQAVNSTLRHSDKEQKAIKTVIGNYQGPVKAFIIGNHKTGVTALMNSIAGQIINHERGKKDGTQREVVVQKICGNDIVAQLLGIKKDDEGQEIIKQGLAGLAGQFGLGDVGDLLKGQGSGLLSVMLALRKKLEDATKEESKRIVLQFDEVNAIWSLARTQDNKYDTVLIGNVVNILKDLSEKNCDILFACNTDPGDPLGLASVLSKEELQALLEGNLGKWYREVYQKGKISLSLPDTQTKSRIAAAYLTNLPKHLGIDSAQLFASEINDSILDEETLAQELVQRIRKRFEILTIPKEQLQKANFDTFEARWIENDAFSKLTQGLIEEVINSDLNSARSNNPITFDIVIDSLVKKVEPDENVITNIQENLKTTREENAKAEQAYTPNVRIANELINKLNKQQLLELWNDNQGKGLLVPFMDGSILNYPTTEAKELQAKLLISFIESRFPK